MVNQAICSPSFSRCYSPTSRQTGLLIFRDSSSSFRHYFSSSCMTGSKFEVCWCGIA